MRDRMILGRILERTDIHSSLGPFQIFPDCQVRYPSVVIGALGSLYTEYGRAFGSLVEANREWETDYQYCAVGDGVVNWAVQIDMLGLTQGFLKEVAGLSEEVVREVLRRGIFEIENSLAMYQLLERSFPKDGRDSFFKTRFRAALDSLREYFGRPIALLAVTNEKYAAMASSEFGISCLSPSVPEAVVRDLSGFDRLFGPEEFRHHVVSRGGECEYLLYVRASDPVSKLKDPGLRVRHPLLDDPDMRRVIKANSVTLNIDDPDWSVGDPRRINDTKEYMPPVGLGLRISSEADLFSREFLAYLETHRIDPAAVASGRTLLRCKPVYGAYGCYGHVVGSFSDDHFWHELRREINQRGPYIVQPEHLSRVVTNTSGGGQFVYIDRLFFATVEGHPQFLGGFRNFMPVNSIEAQRRRIHGNKEAVFAEIVPA